MATFSIYLPTEVKKRLDDLVQKTGKARNKLITEAIDKYLKDKK